MRGPRQCSSQDACRDRCEPLHSAARPAALYWRQRGPARARAAEAGTDRGRMAMADEVQLQDSVEPEPEKDPYTIEAEQPIWHQGMGGDH